MSEPGRGPSFTLLRRCVRCGKRHLAHLGWWHPAFCHYGRKPYPSRGTACMARACMFAED